MTNEEKARELKLYEKAVNAYPDNWCKTNNIAPSDIVHAARMGYQTGALEMAKWKDEDFLAYLVDLRERVKTTPEISCIDRIISERFSELYNEANGVDPRTEPGFYCQGRVCSWDDLYSLIGKGAMMHDYPYYFDEDGNDIFPNER